MRLFFFFCFSLISLLSYCQTPQIGWKRSYGGGAYDGNNHSYSGAVSVYQTSDRGSIVAGTTYSPNEALGYHGNGDIWILKLDHKGEIEWEKYLGGTSLDYPKTIKQTFDKGYIIIGSTDSQDGDVSGPHGQTDAWIVKLDSTGKIMWERCLGGSGGDYGMGIALTKDSGYYLACLTLSIDGDVSGIPSHGEDYWVVRLDKEGKIEWEKVLGGKKIDEPDNIDQTYDGGCIVTGITNSTDGDVTGYLGGPFDCWVVKLDSSGNINWEKCLGGSNGEQGGSLRQTLDSGYIITCSTLSTDKDAIGNHGFGDILIIKLDKEGKKFWSKCYGGSNLEQVQDIQLSGNGYALTGISNSNDGDVSVNYGGNDYWALKIDSIGNIIWQISLGAENSDMASTVSCTRNKEYLIAGYSNSVTGGQGNYDFWIVKLKQVDVLPVSLLSFTAKKQNNITLLQWQTTHEINNSYFGIERSADSKAFSSIGKVDGLNGTNANNYSFTDNTPLQGTNYYRLKQVDDDGKFVYSNVVSVEFSGNASAFAVSPNPASNNVNITIPASNSVSKIIFYDVTGKKVIDENVRASVSSKQFDVSRLSAGSYTIVLIQGNVRTTKKFIKLNQ